MICHWLVLNDIFNVDVCYLCKNSFEAATYSGGIKKKSIQNQNYVAIGLNGVLIYKIHNVLCVLICMSVIF